MYVHLNCFDYDKLLRDIVTNYELEDQKLSTEMISKIFKDLGKVYSGINREDLSGDRLELVQKVIVSTINWRDYRGENPEEFAESCGESLTTLLETLTEALSEPSEEYPEEVNDLCDLFVKIFYENGQGPGEDEVEYLADCISSLGEDILGYVTPVDKFSEAQLGIMKFIEEQLLPTEILVGLEILDIPGQTVNWDDTLITFPLILIKVIQ